MSKVYSWVRENLSLLVAVFIALPVTAFIAFKNAKFDMLFADAISDNNFLQAPFVPHDINIQAIHTHLLKWPVALLENAIGFNFHTHAIISFVLLVAMNAGLVYLFYIFSGRNKLTTSLCLLILTSVELMTGISANEGTLTMITIRNIELPITIGAILVLLHQKSIFTLKVLLSITALAIVFVTDQLLLFTSVIGAILYAVFIIMKDKSPFKLRDDKIFYAGIASSVIISKAIAVFISVVGIANFYELRNTNDKLTFVGSFNAMFESILNNIGKIFDVFGAGFFGQQLEYGPLYLINIALLVSTAYLLIALFRRTYKERGDGLDRTLVALVCMYFIAMLVFTILIPRELAGRYFAFLPVIGILLVAQKYRNLHLSLNNNRVKYSFAFGSIIVFMLFIIATVCANDIYYKPKYAALSSSLGDTSAIVSILQKEKVEAYITMDIDERGYWTGQAIKQQYDERTRNKLAIGSVFCDNYIIDRQFTRKSWVSPSNEKVAVHIKGCDLNRIKQYLGNPTTSYEISKNNTILIFQNDIRAKFRTDQFDTNSFVK